MLKRQNNQHDSTSNSLRKSASTKPVMHEERSQERSVDAALVTNNVRELYSLLSDHVKRPVPRVMLTLCPCLTQLDTEEFCLACMLTCMPECRTGRAKSKENTSSKPVIMDCSFTSSLPEVVI